MDWFQLQPGSILALTQILLTVVVALYLLSLRPKTRDTWLLIVVFSAAGLICVPSFAQAALYTPLAFHFGPVDDLAIPVVLYALLHFAYGFVYKPFPREARLVLGVAGLLVGANALYQVYRIAALASMSDVYVLAIELLNLGMIVAALSVYRRKQARLAAERAEPVAQPDKARQALRAFMLLTVGMLLMNLRGLYVAVIVLVPGQGAPSPFLTLISLLAFVVLILSFLVVYINHMPQPTTIQVRIVGLSLATVLAVLGLADLVLFSEAKLRDEATALLPGRQTLRFEPGEQGGYRVAHVPFRFDAELGDTLRMGPESDSLVTLGFAFPFAGTSWRDMYIDSNGLVAFGAPYLSRLFDDFYADEQPKIAPYYRSLVPLSARDSGVFYKREPDKVTVTWLRVWESLSGEGTNRNTVQLVLHRRGAIDFVYDRVEAPLDGRGDGLRGVRPGGARPPVQPVRFAELPPEAATAALLPDRNALRFEPAGTENYTYGPIPFRFDADLGDDLRLGDDTNAAIPLDFAFPFYAARWQEAYVSANGAVAFGGPVNPPDSAFFRPLHDFFTAQPKIAPLFVDLNPAQGGGVFYKREADKATITWYQVPLLNTPFTSTVQLVLYARGAIDFVYERVGVQLYATDLWGVYPGDARARATAAEYLFDAQAYPAPAGAVLVEDLNLIYRRFVHAKMAPLAYVVFASTLFVLIVFPFFFRTSLIRPLQVLLKGVRRVDTGDLEASVPVRANDEIGVLAENFNRMTASLKTAEAQLKTYAEGLEHKVAERTQDLQTALRHLTETQDQLIHAEKMASLGQLTAGIAHEIKNPLNFVNNFAALSVELADELVEELEAHEGKPLPEVLDAVRELLDDLKQSAGRIREHGRRADGIVQSMLEHASSGQGERRAVAVNALLDEYVRLAHHSLDAVTPAVAVTVARDYDEAVGTVDIIPKEMGRVFLNLLNNAFYAVHERARAGEDAYTPTVSVSTHRADGWVEVRVVDNGPGVAADLREKIFEPFFTTKPTGEGTGLGLSISYDIVTQGHGGTMTVASAEGEGTTFVITLPA